MTCERAIILLSQMYLPHFDEEEKEALSLAIEVLSSCTSAPFVTCSKCGKKFRRYAERSESNDYGYTDYSCNCPECGKSYEWDDCYWR